MSNDKSVLSMFHVEKMTLADFAFAVQLANTMEWNMTSKDFQFNAALEPEGCFTLFDGAERVGLVTCISYGHVGWFGNLIVEPKRRRKGAGTQLVKHAVSYLQNVGVKTVGLYAYSHLAPFYEQLGFKSNAEFVVLKAEKVASAEKETLKAANRRDIPALVELDSRCFGASRQKLLELILLNKGNLCQVALEESEIVGFAAAKVYSEMAEVGPLVCNRNRPDAAVELLENMLGKLRGCEVFMCAPASETELLMVAVKAGFAEEFQVARMFLGSLNAQNCIYIAESLERG